MHRLLATSLVLLSTSLLNSASAYDLMPPYILQQLGLEEAWARPVPAPTGLQSIAAQKLFVHQSNPREYVEIVMASPDSNAAPSPDATAANNGSSSDGTASAAASDATAPAAKVLSRIATDHRRAGGQPIGRQEAERLANNEIRRLKRRGIDAKMNVRTVPRVHLYSISGDGALECRDAETGQPIWMVMVGDSRLPFMSLGVSENYITVINGANLLQVDAATGEVIEEFPMPGTPAYGATNAGDFAMIPLISGGIQCYPLADPTIDPFLEQVAGAALTLPVKSPDSSRTAWTTDLGFVYVIEMQGTPSLLFRFKTDGIVTGRLAAASGDRFFFGSEAGQAYGLRATRSGKVMWSQPVGEPFYHEPLVVDEYVLLRSTYGNLFAFQIDDGHHLWPTPVRSIGGFVGVLDGRLYATSLSGALTVIDLKTGNRLATFPEMRPAHTVGNHLTDRIYLVSENGDVQCLRRAGADLPTLSRQPDANPVVEEEEGVEKPETPEAPTLDPFAPGGTDPFGGGGTDPFGGGGGDPFGGGGGADPFGGNNGGVLPAGGGPNMNPGGRLLPGGGNNAPANDPFGGL